MEVCRLLTVTSITIDPQTYSRAPFRARLLALEIFGYRTEQLVAPACCGRLLQASNVSYIKYGMSYCKYAK